MTPQLVHENMTSMSNAVDVPPGVSSKGKLVLENTGGDGEWAPLGKIRLYTNAFIIQEGKVSIFLGPN